MLCLVRRRRGGGWMLWMGTCFNKKFVNWGVRCSGIDLPRAYMEGYFSEFTADETGLLICVYIFACRPEFTLQAKKEISRLVLVYE